MALVISGGSMPPEVTRPHAGGSEPLDLVGIGFGPSNLGLAIAIEEHVADGGHPVRAEFVEAQERFGWHTGMLLPGTTMQISFLKDLATQRNARSRYSFVNYLSERGRLTDFINLQNFFPTRVEFHDYLTWAAESVSARVRYGTRAVAVHDVDGALEVVADGPDGRISLRTRNVVLAGGLTPRLPSGVRPSARQFHNHRLLARLAELPEPTHRRFVVVGSGQSAAEVTEHLLDRFESAEVHGVFNRYGYSPADDSPFANRVFDPAAVDDFYVAEPAVRRQLLEYHRGTNYSCVDLDLIESLYRREYSERVGGTRRLFLRGASRIRSAVETADGVRVQIEHNPTRTVDTLDCDAVVYATGFDPMPLRDLLSGVCDPQALAGEPAVSRDYRLLTRTELSGNIYLQGGTEHTHGLSSSLLSNIAVRSAEILQSITTALASTGDRA
ncbi:lysine N(6)-hydroxylase/L-ornithine N(5)-oxygenase family protein [Pseudonocardia benzenivorans]|jgi:L-ornithine N5-oxygenase|uniref:L-lysine N6-monooxygenase MbtG n=2 Tax=Pseudonocardia TaxID=1847 RepID=F4CM37_PSEUX|nr:SidA/IucD/PvdA family monooxygenase [Pseudonocardia dioxanivorans]AEA22524.1 L-lysine 6-monooxygenase (NADPH) [Pseudonocardia dioxanivorans CB1190]GJF01361.1 L-ornithine 5-monooxygenase [Pseudonocardia sp. D17]